MDPEYPLHSGPVHPACRSGVPGPSATADMRLCRIYVGTYHIRLDFVAMYSSAGACMVDGIEQRKKLSRAIAVTQHRECQRGPYGGVSVLATILPQSWRIGFDVARVMT